MESYEYCGTLGTGDIKDLENPTSDEVTTIANKINSGELGLPSAEMTQDGKDYKLNAEAGEYLILVTGSNDVIYNPAVVSVNVPSKLTMVRSSFTRISRTLDMVKSIFPSWAFSSGVKISFL